ncbi:hypothetical protein KTH11_13865 [Acinetobacter baumannii]|nr:hypothetical protein [Acinetobacter baumannii]MDC5201490.1 hypothetical protein [Acinetobacter baumannii]
MQTVTKEQFLEIVNGLAQQQDEYFEGLIFDSFENVGGIFRFSGQGFSDGKGNINLEKWELVDSIIKKIEPDLRANYIVIS